MKYKIINTTDRKNLGLIIESDKSLYVLLNNYTFIPTNQIIKNNTLILYNHNYIIESIKI